MLHLCDVMREVILFKTIQSQDEEYKYETHPCSRIREDKMQFDIKQFIERNFIIKNKKHRKYLKILNISRV